MKESIYLSQGARSATKGGTGGNSVTHGGAWLQFRIRYYMFALVFVVFDVETVFLYPWAMSFDVLGVSVFIEAFIFVLILVVGLVYAWRKGALEWS
ncbi:hypothetical protein SETIT_J008200v2 [Setaria italica]|uniref:NADH-ubiquinone oxidoreductase chain 3 n=1 Tax=Setaria italica TaxID=4555 RepID=A0A368PE57_SETIT|nr:hypothetical protein SETIT_J008200v2 [Setaria italica]